MSGSSHTDSDSSNPIGKQWNSARTEKVGINTPVESDDSQQKNIDGSMSYVANIISKFPHMQKHVEKLDSINTDIAFNIANLLHTEKSVLEASEFYRLAFDLHDKRPDHYPLAQSLLQVRLLCLLKAGRDLPDDELSKLDHLCIPFGNYIRGVNAAWRDRSSGKALSLIGNAFEEFHTGEEIDALYLEISMDYHGKVIGSTPDRQNPDIPFNLYMYWDKSPPQEIINNFEYHRNFDDLPVRIFDREEAAEWLYQNYGIEARELFLNARHPAEAADFLRVHVINLLGGWWLDADLKLKDNAARNFMRNFKRSGCYFTTSNYVIHNDFFGSCPNSVILNDCLLSLYRNSYLHKGLFIAYKTGPGVFNRAFSRLYHNSLSIKPSFPTIEIFNQNDFIEYIEEFDTPYKHNTPHWQSV